MTIRIIIEIYAFSIVYNKLIILDIYNRIKNNHNNGYNKSIVIIIIIQYYN